jgi:hypothetical protein
LGKLSLPLLNPVAWGCGLSPCISITKAQTSPVHMGLAVRRMGTRCQHSSLFAGLCEWRLADTGTFAERGMRPDRVVVSLASSSPLHLLSDQGSPLEENKSSPVSACLPVSFPTLNAPWGPLLPGPPLQPPLLRCVRAWGLRSRCLAQTHILFLSLCNNQCSWQSQGQAGAWGGGRGHLLQEVPGQALLL